MICLRISLTSWNKWQDQCDWENCYNLESEATACSEPHFLHFAEMLGRNVLAVIVLNGNKNLWFPFFMDIRCVLLCLRLTSNWWNSSVIWWEANRLRGFHSLRQYSFFSPFSVLSKHILWHAMSTIKLAVSPVKVYGMRQISGQKTEEDKSILNLYIHVLKHLSA